MIDCEFVKHGEEEEEEEEEENEKLQLWRVHASVYNCVNIIPWVW